MMEKDISYFTIEAPTPREALERMRRQYGAEAKILTHKTVRRGGLLGLFTREAVEVTGYVPRVQAGGRKREDIEEAKKKILADARREQALQLILKEIQTLKENMGRPVPPAQAPQAVDRPAGLTRITDLLRLNEFAPAFIEETVDRVRREFSLEDLDNFPLLQSTVLEWIGARIRIHKPPDGARKGAKVFILVGPTGVGKTTTIAKLAAIYSVGARGAPGAQGAQGAPPHVKIVTIDNYRIGALKQIETYAEIMRVPVACVETAGEFKKYLALAQENDFILVDTIGRSPRDLTKLGEMKGVLDAAGTLAEIQLAVSATTKASDVAEILKTFEPFSYRAVILTKLDETLRIGNLISVLAGLGKPVSFIADGQSVPQDIERASVLRLLMNLEGFQCPRERLEKLFGRREKIADALWS
jgi:flagellar biosynthesis protein FlhF